MSDPSGAEPCRLVVHAPHRTFEIAVPTDVPVAELLPTLVLYAEDEDGEDLDESGLEHDGWILQQLGDEPVPADETLASLGLYHGETLYLRPRRDQLPPIHFDDLVAGVAVSTADRADRWSPSHTRVTLQALALGALLLGALVLFLGDRPQLTVIAGAGGAVLMLLGSVSASRAMGDPVASTGLAACAVLYMTLAGAALPTGQPGTLLTGAQILTGAMAGAGATTLGVAAVAGSVPFFTGVFTFHLLTALGAIMVMFIPGATVGAAAGGTAALALLVATFSPQLSFRLSGMRLPSLPSNPEQLQEEIDPYPARQVLERGTLADHFQTGLLAATGAVLTITLVVLAWTGGWVAISLCVVTALVVLLQTRGMASARQRFSHTAPPVAAAVALVLYLTREPEGFTVLTAMLVLAAVAGALAVLSWSVPGKRMLPHWGRAAEIFQAVLGVAVVPLVLGLFGVYGLLRAIGG
ncbi:MULTISPECIES: type VII secretion integral membrane protein EccD [unclassified Nocardiopsis]|uniref:type VII secretion integral membrane protein EccD n=1 Tax=Nocardiopsis TaxID=2013 RepID=UPI00387A8F77